MDNYIVINGVRIELTEEQIKQLVGNKRKLSEIAPGDTFKVGEYEFICLEHREEGTAVLLKEPWRIDKFDTEKNDYRISSIREALNTEFACKLAEVVGEDNIVSHKVDLTADDGRKEYDHCWDEAGLMTCEDYRKYVYILDKYRPKRAWWLATPYSTEANRDSSWVRLVDVGGTLRLNNCYYEFGVRPFCILKSDIFVSE